jgi:CRISPR-associated protein Cas1
VIHQKEAHDIPVKKVSSILINKSAKLTSDVMFLAIEHEIEIILISKIGKPEGRIWSPKYGSISNIRKNQVSFSQSSDAVNWIKDILANKISNQQILLMAMQKYDLSNKAEVEQAYSKLNEYLIKIQEIKGKNINDIASSLRGIEGNASRLYFRQINQYLPDMYKFSARSQHPAFDMFNSMLNYSYGMLYNHVERSLIKAGIDPYVGIMHRDEYNRPVLVFDIIEQYRVWADFVVIDLCMQKVMFPDFFDVENDVWLLNENGKRILIQSINDYMNEIIERNTKQRSRITHIELDAQNFATQLKNWKEIKKEPF